MNVCLPNLTFTHTQPDSIQCVHVWTYPMIYKYQACITTNPSAGETKRERERGCNWSKMRQILEVWACAHVCICPENRVQTRIQATYTLVCNLIVTPCGHVHMCAYVQKTECKLESKLRTTEFSVWRSYLLLFFVERKNMSKKESS